MESPGAHQCNQVMKRNFDGNRTDCHLMCGADSPLCSLPVRDASNPEETSDKPRWTDAPKELTCNLQMHQDHESQDETKLLLTKEEG